MLNAVKYQFTLPLIVLLILPFYKASGLTKADTVSYTVHPQSIGKDFEITGNLEKSVWNKTPSVFIKHQVQPNDEAHAPVRTEVKVLHSDEHLYIGFRAHDPQPGKIRANVADRDNSFRDDFVGVFLDPFNNNQRAYEFFINPLGVQMDGMLNSGSEDMNFDALWYSEGAINDSGYTAVMKIPFKSLNFPNKDIQNWSIQFIRNYPRNNRYQLVWTDVSLNNSCLLCQNGELANLQGLESSNSLEVLPYAMGYQSGKVSDAQSNDSKFENKPFNARVGGSVSYSPNSTTSLNAVVNPDFSQVETDAAQINANETFALYYPEKRPFFMKGASLFETSQDLFYSRMINRPLAAGKFTKNTDHYSLAFLTSYDRNAPFIVPGRLGSSKVTSDVNAYSNVFRGKYNFGSESHVGGIITTRNQGDGFNYVGSVDWKLLLTDHYYFNGQAGYSETRELNDSNLFNEQRKFGKSGYDAAFNGEQYGGMLINAEFKREAKNYNFSFEYSSLAPTFQSHNGFINRTDRRQFEVDQNINFYPNSVWLSRGGVNLHGNWEYDYSGKFQERFIYANLYNRFTGQTSLSIGYLPLNDERFHGKMFTGLHRTIIRLRSDAFDAFSFGGNLEIGRFVRRTQNPKLGQGYNFSANATLEPTSRLQLSLDYSYSTLSSLNHLENYFSGDIIRLNSKYHFSRKFFARVITQYNSFSEQLQIYPLLYYKVNPFTKFYIGMTDYLNKYSPADGLHGFRQTNRQFFVKFQYLFQS